MKIGIVLSGGGARGFVHLGVLKALEEQGIKPDIISGTSAGAIVGAFIAAGFTADEIFRLTKDKKFIDYAKLKIPKMGFFSLEKFGKNLEKILKIKTFEQLSIPLFIAVTNLSIGEISYLSKGSLIEAIKASCSIPVLFTPITINNQLYVDGGLLNNLPYQPLIEKCDKIIIIDVSANKIDDDIDNIIDVARRTFELSIISNFEKQKYDLIIKPKGLTNFNILNSENSEQLFKLGYDYCKNIQKDINEFKKEV